MTTSVENFVVLSDAGLPRGVILVNPRALYREADIRISESAAGVRIEVTAYAPALLVDAAIATDA